MIQFVFYLFLLFLLEIRFFERVYIFFSNKICFNRVYSEEIDYNYNSNNNANNNENDRTNNNINNIDYNSLYSRLQTESNFQRNSNFTTKIKHLYKTYFVCRGKNVKAINDLNLNLEKNEHFGLIGFNGSGKTTTFKSITREIFFDRGSIELFGLNVSKSSDFAKLTKEMGYCPQENALFDYLTVEEVLKYFRNLKSYQKSGNNSDISDENGINKIYEKFGLSKYKNKMTTNLSGGNKRKLNFAIALMNNPKIILLDEPSTGVDPESRRLMWINLLSLKREYNMILSTHSMEEAEVLSDRVGWMKEGRFAVEGVPEELKIKFSSGYYLFIKFISLKQLLENEKKNNKNIILNEKDIIDNINMKDIKEYFSKIIKNEKEMKILCGEESNEFNISEENNIFIMNKINEVFKKIEGKYKDVKVIEREIDNNSFKFLFHIEQDSQGEMFKTILNIKSNMNEVSEINMNIESLENIVTKFQ
jgi:ABC-type multidrug transport system ATPase subunit